MEKEKNRADLSKLAISEAAREGVPDSSYSALRWKVGIALGLLTLVLVISPFLIVDDPPSMPASSAQMPGTNTLIGNEDSSGRALYATGYVVASRQAAVASKATGRLKTLKVEEGDAVKEGDVLGVLENDDLLALVKEREASVEALQARIRFTEAELEDATLNRDRVVQLEKKKVVSRSEKDQALARYKKALSEVESAKANLSLAAAQLERTKVDLSYTFILAPFDGTVLTKNADVGEIVAPLGSSANARAAIVTIADMNSLEVEADVSEANITKIFVGQGCAITLDSYPGKPYKGKVSKIVPTVDRAKATVLTKIKFIDRDDKVIPEMSAKIAFK